MLRCLFAGVSGLKNHQVRMDVIGNNISNINTHGFKKNRVTFQDLLYQNLAGAAAPSDELGGINPQQVGLGMKIASIDTIFTQGALETTGRNLDLAIMGEGFFILKNGDKTLFSRNGAFGIDKNGTLVYPANGFRVQGWSSKFEGGKWFINNSDPIGDIIIPVGSKSPAKATETVWYKSNLNSETPFLPEGREPTPEEIAKAVHKTTIDIYDSKGNVHQLELSFERVQGTENQWRVSAKLLDQPDIQINLDVPGNNMNNSNSILIQFNNEGAIVSASDLPGVAGAPFDIITNGILNANVSFTLPDGQQQTINLNLGTSGKYDGITQFASPTSTKAIDQDGYPMGYLETFIIDNKGVITGIYSNGEKIPLGQIALATFTNPEGLEKAGDNMFVQTNNSGIALVGAANTAGKGSLQAGTLEMSNVDLSEEFTSMIITQRGFEANSRTIVTGDQMIQTILGLKR
jgi:flagellar hook protein FlgE